jgi:hypothetical protein
MEQGEDAGKRQFWQIAAVRHAAVECRRLRQPGAVAQNPLGWLLTDVWIRGRKSPPI